jgi:hypothetical protein
VLKVARTADAGESFLSVACPTASLCAAADYGGQVFTSTDPQLQAQATWRPAPGRRDAGQWRDISCPSSSMCVIVGPEIVTLTDPGTPAERVAEELLPRLLNPFSEADELHGVSCRSVSLCLIAEARGNVVISTDPASARGASWRAHRVDRVHALQALSCASPSLCVAVDDHGYAFVAHGPRVPAGHGQASVRAGPDHGMP